MLQGTPTLEELKLQYYHLLIRYHINANNYIDACRCYRAVYESDSIKDDKEKWVPVSFEPGEVGVLKQWSLPPARLQKRSDGFWCQRWSSGRTTGLLPVGVAEELLEGGLTEEAADGQAICCSC